MRIFNLENVRPIRDLDPIDIDSLVAIKGMITRTGNIIPDLRCGQVLQGAACVLMCVLLLRPRACRLLLHMSAGRTGWTPVSYRHPTTNYPSLPGACVCVAHCSRCARTDAARTLLLLLPLLPPPNGLQAGCVPLRVLWR